MKTEKWVPCTKELAENPERVKAWRVNKRDVRFLIYDKGHDFPIIARFKASDNVTTAPFYAVECLIEVPIQERFVTFYEGKTWHGRSYPNENEAKGNKTNDCTHILKLTYDGEKFQVECVWTKQSNS